MRIGVHEVFDFVRIGRMKVRTKRQSPAIGMRTKSRVSLVRVCYPAFHGPVRNCLPAEGGIRVLPKERLREARKTAQEKMSEGRNSCVFMWEPIQPAIITINL